MVLLGAIAVLGARRDVQAHLMVVQAAAWNRGGWHARAPLAQPRTLAHESLPEPLAGVLCWVDGDSGLPMDAALPWFTGFLPGDEDAAAAYVCGFNAGTMRNASLPPSLALAQALAERRPSSTGLLALVRSTNSARHAYKGTVVLRDDPELAIRRNRTHGIVTVHDRKGSLRRLRRWELPAICCHGRRASSSFRTGAKEPPSCLSFTTPIPG